MFNLAKIVMNKQDKNSSNRTVIVEKVITPQDIKKWAIIAFAFIFFMGLGIYAKQLTKGQQVSVTQAISEVKQDDVKKLVIEDSTVYLETKDNKNQYTNIESQSSFLDLLQKEGIKLSELKDVDIKVQNDTLTGIEIISAIVNILFLIFMAYSVYRFLGFFNKQGSGSGLMSFGKSPARVIIGKKTNVTFNDVAGLKEVKEEISEIVEFLKNPKKFQKMGARIPKGVLLEGPPGTGKTLLARAVAGEAGVPFFHTSGAEFEEMLVGAGAARVRDLFKRAKAIAPSIIFIDEIDAVAKKRGVDFRSTYSEQTLNQILVEMDGFEKTDTVIVIAATNRVDVLDPALMRPGRFDRRIHLSLPDIYERKEILQIHSKNKKLAENVDLQKIAAMTVGFSGADLENLMNEAAILAVRAGKSRIEMEDLIEAMYKVSMGPQRKTFALTKKDLVNTAYHEAGHAIVATYIKEAEKVQTITIVPRGHALGATVTKDEIEKVQTTYKELLARIAVLTGGRVAESLVFGKDDISAGAASDIEKASSIARAMVKELGMSSKLGFVKYATEDSYLLFAVKQSYSDSTAEKIDKEVLGIVEDARQLAERILIRERKLLDKVAEELLKRETLDSKEFAELVAKYGSKKPPEKDTAEVKSVAEWIEKENGEG